MVQIIRNGALPSRADVPEALCSAAAIAATIPLREPRPIGFPLLFSADLELIEPAVAFLHEHAVQRAHTTDTVRTYAEILYDWFETLEQNRIDWSEADAADLIAYRNRMVKEASAHTQRPYSIRTINHRIRGVLRFYEWAVRSGWLRASPLIGCANDFALARRTPHSRAAPEGDADANVFVLRQFASLPRPLSMRQARELLVALVPPYDLMARWQLYTGLRVSELLRLTVEDVLKPTVTQRATPGPTHQVIDVLRKGRKNGYVIASASLRGDGKLRVHPPTRLADALDAQAKRCRDARALH
jgi:integrase/recombinase XerD